MSDDDIRALADQIEAHASNYVHAAATERLLRRAAAALTALMAERDEARNQIRLLGNAAVRVTLERDGMRRAAFARAKMEMKNETNST